MVLVAWVVLQDSVKGTSWRVYRTSMKSEKSYNEPRHICIYTMNSINSRFIGVAKFVITV